MQVKAELDRLALKPLSDKEHAALMEDETHLLAKIMAERLKDDIALSRVCSA